MAGKERYAVLDARGGFHQFPIAEASRHLTAFTTPFGLFQYNRAAMGLTGSPAYFQEAFSKVLAGLLYVSCELYVDDIIVYGESDEEFLVNLNLVLTRLDEADIRIKLQKCQLGMKEVSYLGHVVNRQGIKIAESRRDALRKIAAPTNKMELQSFLGLCNYMKQFIPNFALLATELNALTTTKSTFDWKESHQSAFAKIKGLIVNSSLLHHLDYTYIILRCDASTKGVGGSLLQVRNNNEEVVSYFSKTFTGASTRWSTIEQEGFALVYGLLHFEHYLKGIAFTIESDHKNLEFFKTSAVPKLVRWGLIVQQFDYVIRHISGRTNHVADALSRLVTPACDQALATLQVDSNVDLELYHNSIVGHKGLTATLKLLHAQGIHWPGMIGDVSKMIRSCATCQKLRVVRKNNLVPVEFTNLTSYEPFYTVSVDTIVNLPRESEHESANKHLIVMVCNFTRIVELCPVPDLTQESAMLALMQLFSRYGCPTILHSDNGGQFIADAFKKFCEMHNIQQTFTVPHHPQGNGIAERTNGEVMRHLRAIIHDRNVAAIWDKFCPIVQRIINSSYHSSIGTSPAELLYAGTVNLDRNLDVEKMKTTLPMDRSNNEFLDDYVQAIETITAASYAHMDKALTNNRKNALPRTSLLPGEYVLIMIPPSAGLHKPASKTGPRHVGPRIVVKKTNSNTYIVKDLLDGTDRLYHVERLLRFTLAPGVDPIVEAAKDKLTWKADHVVMHKGTYSRTRSTLQFLIHWTDTPESEDTWEEYNKVKHLTICIAYKNDHPGICPG